MIRRVLVALAALAVAGAAWADVLPAAKISGFSKGHTTKAEVLTSLGEPVKQSRAPDGNSLLRYDYTAPPGPGAGAGKPLIILFVFSPADVFLGIQVYARNDDATPAQALTRDQARPMSELRDENVLTPLPAGFGIGAQGDNGPVHTTELIPAGETVKDWSRMITQQTFLGRRSEDPSKMPTQLSIGWKQACPGGSAEALATDTQNGYPAMLWRYVCPLNPATGKPETMWLRVISGADALYSVQYAYRRALNPDMEPEALAYLKTVSVCDTRSNAHPCPH